MQYALKFFVDKKGKCPVIQWLENLSTQNQDRIAKRLRRIEEGNLGDYKQLEAGLYELKFDFGSGYRVYFTKNNNIVILLLCGGDKASQKKDIDKAKQYLREALNV